jgi:Lysozyme like domain
LALVPSYPQPYTLFNPVSGHPLFSGPNGEPGYGGPVLNSVSWIMPDGRRAWWHPGDQWDESNRVALGLDVGPVAQDGGIGYDGAFAAAQSVGADNASADTAAAISLAESGGHWSDHNSNPGTGDDSIGLWQINLRAHPQYRNVNLYNIAQNAEAMRSISVNFLNWTPWSTYNSGAYRKFLRGAGGVGQTTGPPPAPSSSEGPVERLIDGLLHYIPDIPLIGGAIRDGVRAVLHPIAAAIDAAIALIVSGVSDAVTLAHTLADEVLADAEQLYNSAVKYADTGLHALATFVAGLIADAVHTAEAFASFIVGAVETVARDLVNAAVSGLTDVIDFGIGALRTVISDVQSGLTDALNFGIGALRTVIDTVQAGLTDALHLVDAAWREAVAVVDAAWREGLSALETVLRDAIGAVDSAWQAFVRDVFGPVEVELRHWFDDVLTPLQWLFDAAGKLRRVITWVVTNALDEATATYDAVKGIGTADPVELLYAGAQRARSVGLLGQGGAA